MVSKQLDTPVESELETVPVPKTRASRTYVRMCKYVVPPRPTLDSNHTFPSWEIVLVTSFFWWTNSLKEVENCR